MVDGCHRVISKTLTFDIRLASRNKSNRDESGDERCPNRLANFPIVSGVGDLVGYVSTCQSGYIGGCLNHSASALAVTQQLQLLNCVFGTVSGQLSGCAKYRDPIGVLTVIPGLLGVMG